MRALLLVLLAGCSVEDGTIAIPNADAKVFQTQVYPVLLRDCGFTTCHGNPGRFFAVYGPGRTRLDPSTPEYDPVTPYELALTFTRARSMLVGPDGPLTSLLVRKPIPIAEGGAGHKGDDPWGNTVYASSTDARFQTIARWAAAAQ